MDAWLVDAADALARRAGIPRERLDLDEETVRTLLDLARIAAHESGERTNAPLVCYLVGLCRASELSVRELFEAVGRSSS
jgi:hypothetical protein